MTGHADPRRIADDHRNERFVCGGELLRRTTLRPHTTFAPARGVSRSVADLQESLDAFIAARNKDPNQSSGPPRKNPSRKSSTVVVGIRRRFSRVVPDRNPENGRRKLSGPPIIENIVNNGQEPRDDQHYGAYRRSRPGRGTALYRMGCARTGACAGTGLRWER